MSPLVQYEAMRTALMQCASIDEAAEIRDKAAALAAYTRQRDDAELEVWTQEIKLRASIRIGELVRELDSAQGRRNELPLSAEKKSKEQSILAAGLTVPTAMRYQELAGPREENLQAAGKAAAERYFAQARATRTPGTQDGLRHAVTTAVHAAMGPDEILRAAKGLGREVSERKKDARAIKEGRLAAATQAASSAIGTRLYGVIYADPPWRFATFSEHGMDRAADNHYPTMTIEDICALPIPAADRSVLFLWVTMPLLERSFDVINGWGFCYKTGAAWIKDRIGTGYWFRNKHELLLVGTRGDIPAPAMGTQPSSAIEAPRGRHSEKPSLFAEIIEGWFPQTPKLEMFARQPRPGWDVWGNEAGAPFDDREEAHA